jgi:hypothetical protein
MDGQIYKDMSPVVAPKVLWVLIKWHLRHRAVVHPVVQAMMTQNLHQPVELAMMTQNLRQLVEPVMMDSLNLLHVVRVAEQAIASKCNVPTCVMRLHGRDFF